MARCGHCVSQREFIHIGHAVHPDGAHPKKLAEPDGEIAGGRPGRDDDIGTLLPEHKEYADEHAHEPQLVPTRGVRNYAEPGSGIQIRAVA